MSAAPPADPRRGVFETMLVVDGRPVELDAHIERLAGSVGKVFGAEPPSIARGAVLERARPLRLGRLRLTVFPRSDRRVGLAIETAEVDPAVPFPGWDPGATLRTVNLPGGLGPHKWADRAWLEATEAACGDAIPLFVERARQGDGGEALETSRANLFAVLNGVLVTPPADGRILPGVARARVIEVAREAGIEARERPLALADLRAAEEVFLTGSVRGIEPVRGMDGDELGRRGRVATRLASELRRRWLGDTAE